MKWQTQAVKEWMEEGRLIFTTDGDAFFDGELAQSEANTSTRSPLADQPTPLGFYGEPDENGCRPNIYTDQVIKNHIVNGDRFDAQAGNMAPKNFMFLDEGSMNAISQPKLREIFDHNSDAYFLDRQVKPLQRLDKTYTEGCWFLSLGSYDDPSENRDKLNAKIIVVFKKYIKFWLDDKAARLRSGKDLSDLKPRT